jgi:hypothetical protein
MIQSHLERTQLPTITFGQIEALLKDIPVQLLPEVYEYLLTLSVDTDAERPNALTQKVFEDTDAGRNLQPDQTIEEFFNRVTSTEQS